jgi:hypothetical protein
VEVGHVDAQRQGRELLRQRRIAERVQADADVAAAGADRVAEDLRHADLAGALRHLFDAGEPECHHRPRRDLAAHPHLDPAVRRGAAAERRQSLADGQAGLERLLPVVVGGLDHGGAQRPVVRVRAPQALLAGDAQAQLAAADRVRRRGRRPRAPVRQVPREPDVAVQVAARESLVEDHDHSVPRAGAARAGVTTGPLRGRGRIPAIDLPPHGRPDTGRKPS